MLKLPLVQSKSMHLTGRNWYSLLKMPESIFFIVVAVTRVAPRVGLRYLKAILGRWEILNAIASHSSRNWLRTCASRARFTSAAISKSALLTSPAHVAWSPVQDH